MKYEFNKAKHQHLLDGRALTGCTTVLSVIAKPALISWAANMVVSYINEKAPYISYVEGEILKHPQTGHEYEGSFYLVSEELLEEASKAHCRRKKEAGDYGTKTHEEIENLVLNAIKNNNGIVSGTSDNKSIQNFIDWSTENKVKFLESEKNIYSERLWIGGIVDLVVEIGGQVWIGDIKTSGSGIYAEHLWQCAGYHLMLNDMNLYPNITGYLILNLKENGEVLEKRSTSNEENKKAFLACLDIYRIQEKIKNQVL